MLQVAARYIQDQVKNKKQGATQPRVTDAGSGETMSLTSGAPLRVYTVIRHGPLMLLAPLDQNTLREKSHRPVDFRSPLQHMSTQEDLRSFRETLIFPPTSRMLQISWRLGPMPLSQQSTTCPALLSWRSLQRPCWKANPKRLQRLCSIFLQMVHQPMVQCHGVL